MSAYSFIQRVQQWGVRAGQSEYQRRSVKLSNLLSVLIAGLSLLVVLVLYLTFGWVISAWLALSNAFLYIGLLFLNKAGFIDLSRVLQSMCLPLFALLVSIVVKRGELTIEQPEYFDTRLIILISAIVPLVLFSIRAELKTLYFSLLASFLGLLLFDAVHNLFNVGYYQSGHDAANYAFIRILFMVMYLLLAGSFIYYKRLLEHTELQLNTSHQRISGLNKVLQEQNDSLQAQHEELLAQNEEITRSQEMLHEANRIIEEQKQVLVDENRSLYQHLLEKNELLEETNRQLQHRLEEVRQFSYTISHNLRGPVASLLGLFNLIDKEKVGGENQTYIGHAATTAQALDTVIQDLSKVLQMRDGQRKSEQVNLPQLLDAVLASLQRELDKKQGTICRNLEVETFFSEKAYLHSILYNLISNAVKYAKPGRPPKISISSKKTNNTLYLVVADNGRGIDLNQNEQSLFKLYKRFHLGEEGKGLGLYLVKAQTEALGGKVKVESVVNEGSSFWVMLPCADQQNVAV